jgi:hypothetical protein
MHFLDSEVKKLSSNKALNQVEVVRLCNEP